MSISFTNVVGETTIAKAIADGDLDLVLILAILADRADFNMDTAFSLSSATSAAHQKAAALALLAGTKLARVEK